MAKRILIVEDEEDIIELIEYNLRKEGYAVDKVTTGEQVLPTVRQNPPDLILLDLMLPEIDGLEVCRRLKQDKNTQDIPIMMVTAKSEEVDIVTSLELGAEDYITKPFSPKVLVARVRTILRRQTKTDEVDEEKEVIFKDLRISPIKREVTIKDKPIILTYSEFQALHILLSQPGRVFTRYRLIEKIHGNDYAATDRSIDVLIVSLRKKLGVIADHIETIRGVGYRFKE